MLRPARPSNAITWSRKRAGVAASASVMRRSSLFTYLARLAGRGRIASRDAIRVGWLTASRMRGCSPSPQPSPREGRGEGEENLPRHPVQGAELVAVGIAQIGDVEFDAAAFANARWILAGLAAMGEAGGM